MPIALQERRSSGPQARGPLPPTELQVRKLEKGFASFDTDADGVIDALDVTAMAQVYCEAYGIPARSQSWRRIHQCAHLMWRAVERRTGTLDPAKLTKQEWVSWLGSHEYTDHVTLAAIPFSMMAFWLADADHDGRCDVDELMAAQRRSGMTEAEIRRSFDLLDVDADGYLTTEDFAQALEEYYFSDDPDAPGNSIAGEL